MVMLQTAMIFGNGMVLQQKKPVRIWGNCVPGAEVCVSLETETRTVTADSDGKWMAELPPREAGAGLTMEIQSGNERLVFSDIAVGEVYLAGGQSNMEFQLAFDKHYEEEVETCDESGRIRFFDQPEVCYAEQMQEYSYINEGFWRKNTKKDIGRFTAVGYYFAKHLAKSVDVPVGIIGCNWGGTPACAWMDPKYLKGTKGEIWIRDYEEQTKSLDMESFMAEFKKNPMNDRTDLLHQPMNVAAMKSVMTREAQEKILKEIEAAAASSPVPPVSYERRPGGLYQNMLTKIAPYPVRGVLWYQGESDGDSHPETYDIVFSRLIENWRALWGEELPFLFVQIAPLDQCLMCDGRNYVPLRECQERVSRSVSGAWMTTSGDVGLEWDIHPKDKEPIGKRLTLLARGHVYQEDILCDPPGVAEIRCTQNRVAVRFVHGNGLWIKGNSVNSLYAKLANGERVRIREVILREDEMELEVTENTIALELGQEAYYQINLYNAAGIPAKPFRYELDNRLGGFSARRKESVNKK